MKNIYIILKFFFVSNILAFSPSNIFKSNFKSTSIKVYKKNLKEDIINNYKTNPRNIIFYSGGNSIIPPEIYNNFLKTLASKDFNIYAVTNNKDENEELFDYLDDKNEETIFLGHSTGCVNAIEESNNNKFIKKLILMDPVDNKGFLNINKISFIPNFNTNNEKKNLKLKYVNKVLLLNAEKSYEWSFFPNLSIPFIPAFAMKLDQIENLKKDLKVRVIKAQNYGHSDILDSMYSDFMHKTISRGSEERNEESMYEYYNWLTDEIINFVDSQKEEDGAKIIEKFNAEILDDENIININ